MNSVDIQPYTLPDRALLEIQDNRFSTLCYVPSSECIVLGCGCDENISLNTNEVVKDNVTVYRRPSGGETVLLSPNTVVIAIIKGDEKISKPPYFFEVFSNSIIKVLNSIGVKKVVKRGTSDICIGNKKILGSGIYFSKQRVFYHAVLNVSESMENIARYLKHPPREPDYRKGRSHQEFITSLNNEGYHFSAKQVCAQLDDLLHKCIAQEID